MANYLLFAVFAPLYYFGHRTPLIMNPWQETQEIKFYEKLSSASGASWCFLTMAAGTTIVPSISMLGLLPAVAIQASALTLSFFDLAVYALSNHRSMEMQFLSGKHHADLVSRTCRYMELFDRSERWNTAMLITGLGATLAPILYLFRWGLNRSKWAIAWFVVLCLADCYLVNLLAESREASERARSALLAIASECNWYTRPLAWKIVTFATAVYDRSTGYIMNSERCNRYMSQIAGGGVSMLDALTLSVVRNMGKNLGFLYSSTSFGEKLWFLLILVFVCAFPLLLFPLRMAPRGIFRGPQHLEGGRPGAPDQSC